MKQKCSETLCALEKVFFQDVWYSSPSSMSFSGWDRGGGNYACTMDVLGWAIYEGN